MIRVFRFQAGDKTGAVAEFDSLPAHAAELPTGSVVWIDLAEPTAEEEDRVLKRFLPVHSLTLEDITKNRRGEGSHLPKVEEFPDYLFVIVNPLPAVTGEMDDIHKIEKRRSRPQLSAVITETVLVTHHSEAMPCITEGLAHLNRHAGNAQRGPDYLFHLVLDGIVDDYAPVVDRITSQLDKLETKMFRSPSPAVLSVLLRTKREVTYLRKTLILEREVLARLIRGEFQLVDPREMAYYRNVYDHLVRYTDLIENAREMVSDLMQTHLAATSNRLNEIMKTLTMISTLGMVGTLIVGYYGMNFKHIAELEWETGHWFALGLFGISSVGLLALYRWKKWL